MTETLQTRFRDGYARRFETALAAALVLHVVAIVLVPPRSMDLELPRIDPGPFIVQELRRPEPVYRIVMPEDVSRPGTVGFEPDITMVPDPIEAPVPDPQPSAPALPGVVKAAALQWLFTPGRQRDRAVPCVVQVSIRFRIS